MEAALKDLAPYFSRTKVLHYESGFEINFREAKIDSHPLYH